MELDWWHFITSYDRVRLLPPCLRCFQVFHKSFHVFCAILCSVAQPGNTFYWAILVVQLAQRWTMPRVFLRSCRRMRCQTLMEWPNVKTPKCVIWQIYTNLKIYHIYVLLMGHKTAAQPDIPSASKSIFRWPFSSVQVGPGCVSARLRDSERYPFFTRSSAAFRTRHEGRSIWIFENRKDQGMAPSTYYNVIAIFELMKFLSFKRIGVVHGYRPGATGGHMACPWHIRACLIHVKNAPPWSSAVFPFWASLWSKLNLQTNHDLTPFPSVAWVWRGCVSDRDINHAARDLFLDLVEKVCKG